MSTTFPPKYSLLEAKAKLESFCAYQERCAFEISKKLNSWFIYGEDQDILIADLIANNFLSEERFAEAYVSGKFNIKKWGKIKIKQHLKSKHISSYSINKGLKQIDESDYVKTIHELIDKKLLLVKGKNNWEISAKIKRYLFSKGYETSIVDPIIKEYIKL